VEIDKGQVTEVKMSVQYMSFSAHADAKGTGYWLGNGLLFWLVGRFWVAGWLIYTELAGWLI